MSHSQCCQLKVSPSARSASTTENPTVKNSIIPILLWLACCVAVFADEPISVQIKVNSGFDGSPMWVGVVDWDSTDAPMEWSLADSRKFLIEVSDSVGDLTLVVLKRDAMPIVKSLTSEMLAEEVTIEFSDGKSVSGTVVAAKDGIPITEGLVTVQFDETLGIPVPVEESVFAWELEEGGTFEDSRSSCGRAHSNG